MGWLWLCGATALLLGVPHLAPATETDLRVLFKSGDATTDGSRLTSLGSPMATTPTRVAFIGGTSAILRRQGSQVDVVVRTGDPLPAPVPGSFGTFIRPKINDHGSISFHASVDSSAAGGGLFLYDAGSIVPIALDVKIGQSAINNRREVAYESSRDAIALWSPREGDSSVLLQRGDPVPGGGTFRRLRSALALSDSGAVAFQGTIRRDTHPRNVDALLVASLSAGVVEVVREGDTSAIGSITGVGRQLSVNARGQIAFTAGLRGVGVGVFLYDPKTSSISTVARPGQLVGGTALTVVGGHYVGINSMGDVAFDDNFFNPRLILAAEGRLTELATNVVGGFAPRLTDRGEIVWGVNGRIDRYDGRVTTVLGRREDTPLGQGFTVTSPTVNSRGVVAAPASRNGLYLLSNGKARSVVTVGDTVPRAGMLSLLRPPVLRNHSLAFVGNGSSGLAVMATTGRGLRLRVVAGTGDPTPVGGTFAIEGGDGTIDVRGSTILFVARVTGGSVPSGIFRANRGTGVVRALVTAGTQTRDGTRLLGFDAVAARGCGVAFRATWSEEGDAEGIFVTRGRRSRSVAVTGAPTPMGGTFGFFGRPVVSGGRILFAATVVDGTAPRGLFLWTRGRLTTLLAQGTDDIGNGILALDPVGLKRRTATFAVLSSDLDLTEHVLSRRRVARSIVGIGDATPLGIVDRLSERISPFRGGAVFAASLSPGNVQQVLVSARWSQR